MSKMLEKASKMVSAQARDLLCAIAGPRGWNDTREAWLARAARKLGFGHRRTKAIFYGEARSISADEWCVLQETMADLTRSAAARQGAINELSILARSRTSPTLDPVRPTELADDASRKARLR